VNSAGREANQLTSRFAANAIAFALLLLALLVSMGASLSTSDTWQISVISDTAAVFFPKEVRFQLELESDMPLQEITIHYRVAGQDVASYAYPEWQSDESIHAWFDLSTAGPDYIPPGTEIIYFYTLRDELGQTMQTQEQAFIYEDTRYDWHVTPIGTLELYWYGEAQDDLAYLAPGLEGALEQIQEVLQVEPARPLRGLIYNSQKEAAAAFPPVSATVQQEQLFAGYAFQDKGVFLGVGMSHYLIAHESAHLYMGELLGPAISALPTWVDEGFAVYMQQPSQSYEDFASRLQGETLLPLRAMQTLPGQADQIRLFYSEAPAIVAYLLESYGEGAFHAFLAEFERAATVEEALQAAYGFGTEELDSLWRKGLGGVPQETPFDARFWATVLPSAILVLVILATTIGYAVRYFRRQRQTDDYP